MTQFFHYIITKIVESDQLKLQFLKLLKTGRPLTIYNLLGIEKNSQT